MQYSHLFADVPLLSAIPAGGADGVVSDSRCVRTGDLFVCIRGTRRDGHDHAADAIARGAAYILAEHPIDGVPAERVLLVPDTRAAEARIMANFYGRPTDGMTTVAVTGTAGKTSVVHALSAILRAAGCRVGMLSTVGACVQDHDLTLGAQGGSSVSDLAGAMTTPDPAVFYRAAAEMKQAGCDTFLYEASSQALSQHKLDAVYNDVAVFTNLSPEHLDAHGTMDGYFAAKASLLPRTHAMIVCADDCRMARMPQMAPDIPAIRCSADAARVAEMDVTAIRHRSHGTAGQEYVYFSTHAVFRIRIPLLGAYAVMNTLEAAACAIRLGVDPMTVRDVLADLPPVPGRMMRVETDNAEAPTVYIDYAHTPASLRAAIATLRATQPTRLIVLFGCGGDRDKSKRPAMAQIAAAGADYVVLTSDNPRTEDPDTILDEIKRGMPPGASYTVIPDRRDAIRHAVHTASRGDCILLAGKGHEMYEITARGKEPFDERACVLDAMRTRRV